jgi:hypothetical protein
MTSQRRQSVISLATLAAVGAALIVVGVLALDTDDGTRAFQNRYGQQTMLVLLLIPLGVMFLALPLIMLLGWSRRQLTLRRLVRRSRRRGGSGDDT